MHFVLPLSFAVIRLDAEKEGPATPCTSTTRVTQAISFAAVKAQAQNHGLVGRAVGLPSAAGNRSLFFLFSYKSLFVSIWYLFMTDLRHLIFSAREIASSLQIWC